MNITRRQAIKAGIFSIGAILIPFPVLAQPTTTKVYVFIRLFDNQYVADGAYAEGDIVDILPILPVGKNDLNKHLVVVMDLNIPCGQGAVSGMSFNDLDFNCGRCSNNNYTLCDFVKYTRSEYTSNIVSKKARYNIDRKLFISAESESAVLKDEKTVPDITLQIDNAVKNPQLKTIITDKAAL